MVYVFCVSASESLSSCTGALVCMGLGMHVTISTDASEPGVVRGLAKNQKTVENRNKLFTVYDIQDICNFFLPLMRHQGLLWTQCNLAIDSSFTKIAISTKGGKEYPRSYKLEKVEHTIPWQHQVACENWRILILSVVLSIPTLIM